MKKIKKYYKNMDEINIEIFLKKEKKVKSEYGRDQHYQSY